MCGRSSLRTSKCSGGKATLLDWFTIDDTVLIYTSVYCTSPPSLTILYAQYVFLLFAVGLSCQTATTDSFRMVMNWSKAMMEEEEGKAKAAHTPPRHHCLLFEPEEHATPPCACSWWDLPSSSPSSKEDSFDCLDTPTIVKECRILAPFAVSKFRRYNLGIAVSCAFALFLHKICTKFDSPVQNVLKRVEGGCLNFVLNFVRSDSVFYLTTHPLLSRMSAAAQAASLPTMMTIPTSCLLRSNRMLQCGTIRCWNGRRWRRRSSWDWNW